MKIKQILISILLAFTLFAFPAEANALDIDRGEVKLPIFMYHSLYFPDHDKWKLNPVEFEADLKYLSENGYTSIFISELVDFVERGEEAFPIKPVILTFDDGYYNNLTQALPLLEKYDMKMTLSVIGKPSEEFSNVQDVSEKYGHLSWDELEFMVGTGRVELANHTWDMHNHDSRVGCCIKKGESMGDYRKTLKSDVGKLQEKLEKINNGPVLCFTYPFGSKCPECLIILKEMGFKATLTCNEGMNKIVPGDPESLYELRRVNRAPGKSVKMFLEDLQ